MFSCHRKRRFGNSRVFFSALLRRPFVAPAVGGVFVLLACAPPVPVTGQTPQAETVTEFAQDPMQFFFDLRIPEAIESAQLLLAGGELEGLARHRVLATLGTIYVAESRTPQARAAFLEILNEDPYAELERPERFAPPVVDLFYGLRDSILLASDRPANFDIRTLAVGAIENNSIVPGRFDLDRFARGLTQVMISDLMNSTPLRIVDRQRLSVLRDEIALSSSDQMMDPEVRVPFGKLTGAQSFLFGSIIQAEKDRIRLDLRWVDTSTGEILLADGVERRVKSADDLFKLEQAVLLDLLVPRIQEMLGDGEDSRDLKKAVEPYLKDKKKRLGKGSAYVDLLLKTGEAIMAEEQGDLDRAQAAWAEVGRMDPDDASAQGRAASLAAFIQLNSEEVR